MDAVFRFMGKQNSRASFAFVADSDITGTDRTNKSEHRRAVAAESIAWDYLKILRQSVRTLYSGYRQKIVSLQLSLPK